MPSNPSGPIRRGQLITPFGVGAMVTVPGGTSLIVAGLDYWYKNQNGTDIGDIEEFKFQEWRLQELLKLDHLRLPPDYRDSFWYDQDVPNKEITIPAFRFPTWHFCSDCKLLKPLSPYLRGKAGRIKCPECEGKKKTRYMYQVPFIAMCHNGHVQDFPWNEWVHRSINPSCKYMLRLASKGSATLAGQWVSCEECGARRNLEGITRTFPDQSTYFSRHLQEGVAYLCQGQRPWLGPGVSSTCGAQLKGSLRSASNVYYADIRSSIYLPKVENTDLQEIDMILQDIRVSKLINTVHSLGASLEEATKAIINNNKKLIGKFTEDQVLEVLRNFYPGSETGNKDSRVQRITSIIEEEEIAFRRVEYEALRVERKDIKLKIKMSTFKEISSNLPGIFSQIMLVEKLQETRVLAGFTRVFPESHLSYQARQQMLWKEALDNIEERWMPAYTVFGEGIFFEFDEVSLRLWESRAEVKERILPLAGKQEAMQVEKHLKAKDVNPRFILLHTFAHLVMNRLTFECGYGSAALRERLYVSSNQDYPMAGVLIYTADGDSEGTMGGLVRMGKPYMIEPVIQRAIENAVWCSADPVCMEMGNSSGQGPGSCNLAACHNCALVPETACEEFNRFLDRGVVVGDLGNPGLGFFRRFLESN